jgi:hypothetical protein
MAEVLTEGLVALLEAGYLPEVALDSVAPAGEGATELVDVRAGAGAAPGQAQGVEDDFALLELGVGQAGARVLDGLVVILI